MLIVYITKYALTTGIIKAEGRISDDMVVYTPKGGGFRQYAHGKDFHFTEEDARSRAEEMRIAKLKSLDRQAKKVSAMKFEIVE